MVVHGLRLEKERGKPFPCARCVRPSHTIAVIVKYEKESCFGNGAILELFVFYRAGRKIEHGKHTNREQQCANCSCPVNSDFLQAARSAYMNTYRCQSGRNHGNE